MTADHLDADLDPGCCVIGLTPNAFVGSWNAGAQNLLGYAEDEAVGQHVTFLYTVEDQRIGLPDKCLREAQRAGTTHHVGWSVRKDGSRLWSSVQLTALQGLGALLGYTQVVRHLPGGLVSEATEETFHTAFMHDFRDMLTVVQGFSELASSAGPDDRQEFLDRVEAGAGRLVAMTEGLLNRPRDFQQGML